MQKRRTQRGSVLMLTSIVLVAMLGMLALGIDLGFLLSARGQLQNCIDAAALAGATDLRSTIEAAHNAAPVRDQLIQRTAIKFAALNPVRRFAEPEPESGQESPNKINLPAGNVAIEPINGLPEAMRVRVKYAVGVPLFFAGMFGLDEANVSAGAIAATLPVDGGTGGLNGCWRPLLLPDTFFDAAGTLKIVGDAGRPPDHKIPDLDGDYYRSRFAAGGRNVAPFVDFKALLGDWVTGLRDTETATEIGVRTLMGAPMVTFRRQYYRVADFSGLPRSTYSPLSLTQLAQLGYCGTLRVGMEVPIFAPTDDTAYFNLRTGLEAMKLREAEAPDEPARSLYHYVTSPTYPAANTHPAIIPVLFFDPLELNPERPPHAAGTRVRVTNIGLFFLDGVAVNGDVSGFFVREIIAGGTPVEPFNLPGDGYPSFVQHWLPAAPRLLR